MGGLPNQNGRYNELNNTKMEPGTNTCIKRDTYVNIRMMAGWPEKAHLAKDIALISDFTLTCDTCESVWVTLVRTITVNKWPRRLSALRAEPSRPRHSPPKHAGFVCLDWEHSDSTSFAAHARVRISLGWQGGRARRFLPRLGLASATARGATNGWNSPFSAWSPATVYTENLYRLLFNITLFNKRVFLNEKMFFLTLPLYD